MKPMIRELPSTIGRVQRSVVMTRRTKPLPAPGEGTGSSVQRPVCATDQNQFVKLDQKLSWMDLYPVNTSPPAIT